MNFRELSNYFDETERIAGDYQTDLLIIQNTCITSASRILVISNVGTAVHLAKLVGCTIDLIDMDRKKCDNFVKYIEEEELSGKIRVINSRIEDLQPESRNYNLIICGNIFSVLNKKCRQACAQILVQLLEDGGGFVVTQYFSIEKKIAMEELHSLEYPEDATWWLNFYEQFPLELRVKKEYEFLRLEEEELDAWLQKLFDRTKGIHGNSETEKEHQSEYRRMVFKMMSEIDKIHYYFLVYTKETVRREPYLFKIREVKI